MILMEPDHANITQITGWLHSAERWSELAELAQCQIFNQMAAADWEPYVMTCLEEMGRAGRRSVAERHDIRGEAAVLAGLLRKSRVGGH